MIVDKKDHIHICPLKEEHKEMIRAFILRDESKEHPSGRYPLDGDFLFAIVQTYESKSKSEALIESHYTYTDLQVVLKGSEYMFWSNVDELQVAENHSAERDILFYKDAKNNGCFRVDAGMFAYFSPWDAHMPCICCSEGHPESIRKIVFKIRHTPF